MSLENEVHTVNAQMRQLMVSMFDLNQKLAMVVNTEVTLSGTTDYAETVADTVDTGEAVAGNMSTEEVIGFDSGLPDGVIDFSDVDAMGCPYHDGMMSSTRSKAQTGKTKGCFNKTKSKTYTGEMYIAHRRVLIQMAIDNSPDVEPADNAPVTTETPAPAPTPTPSMFAENAETPADDAPPQLTPLAPTSTAPTALLAVSEPNITFLEVTRRHVAMHGSEQLEHRLKQCGLPADHDISLMEPQAPNNPDMAKVVAWIRAELVKHDSGS